MAPIREGASRRLMEDIKKIGYAYKPVKCFIERDNRREQVSCNKLISIIERGLDNKTKAVVCNDGKNCCVSATHRDNIMVFIVEGKEVYFIVSECDHVKKDQRIGYIITGKGECRTIRSPSDGHILLLHEILGQKFSKYKVVLVVPNE